MANKGGQKAFYSALALFMVARLGLTFVPLSQRDVPIEPDDAYAFIQRAAQIEYCFLKECPALDDILEQVQYDVGNAQTAHLQGHLYHRTFPFIYPLHSLLIFSMHRLGFTWEASYTIVASLGIILVGFSVARLLKVLIGEEATAISLLLLAGYIFPSGLLYSGVPQSWAMALATLCWSIILAEGQRWDRYIPWLLLLPILFHPAGALYTLLSAVLIAVGPRQLSAKWRNVALGLVISLFALLGQTLTTSPTFASGVQVGGTPSTFYSPENILRSFETAGTVIAQWAGSYWNSWVIFPLTLIGFWLLERENRKRFRALSGLVAAMLLSSVLGAAVLRGFPPNLFARLWLNAAILLVGLLGRTMWHWYLFLTRGSNLSIRTTKLGRISVLTLVGALLFLALFDNAKYIGRNYASTIRSRTERGYVTIDPELTAFLTNLESPSHIIYGNEVIFHHALLYGGFHSRASYYPILLRDARASSWLSPLEQDQYILDTSPLTHALSPVLDGTVEVLTDNGDFVLARVIATEEEAP